MDINTAIRHYHAGDFERAQTICQAVLATNPEHGGAQLLLGRIALDSGNHAQAESHLARVVQANPNHMHATLFLAAARLGMEQYSMAGEGFERVLDKHPDVGPAWRYLGLCRLRLGHYGTAQVALSRAVELEPKAAQGWLHLGEVLFHRGRYDDAVAALRRSLSFKPSNANTLAHLGAALARQGKFEEASSCCVQAIAFAPDNVAHRCQLGWIMLGSGQLLRSEQRFREALKAEPDHEDGQVGLATVLERLGRNEEALAIFAPLIESAQEPRVNLLVGYGVVQNRLGNPEVAIEPLETALSKQLSNPDRALAYHMLGTLRESMGQFDQAFEAHAKSNELRNLKFDIHSHQRFIDALIGSANAETLSKLPPPSNPSSLPIFIVGMPRSGTSLVEQILSTHPNVQGSGEHVLLRDLALGLNSRLGVAEPYPICIDLLTQPLIDDIANTYLAMLRSNSSPGTIYVTDKTPFNFLHLGLINIIFPSARVIHCVRDPMDTCLSCFVQNFNNTESYATSLASLGSYYQAYRRLMVHWRGVSRVPILDLEYEELVKSPEAQIRRLLEFCNLEWDPSCLDFHKNPRHINTPSYAQLRMPLFSTSVGRSKSYDRHLDPLRDALGI